MLRSTFTLPAPRRPAAKPRPRSHNVRATRPGRPAVRHDAGIADRSGRRRCAAFDLPGLVAGPAAGAEALRPIRRRVHLGRRYACPRRGGDARRGGIDPRRRHARDRCLVRDRPRRSHSPPQIEVLEAAKAAAFADAQRIFDTGNRIISLACRNGARFPTNDTYSQLQWPSREASEREFWRRPMTAEELQDALS
jgi:hypothetical protein